MSQKIIARFSATEHYRTNFELIFDANESCRCALSNAYPKISLPAIFLPSRPNPNRMFLFRFGSLGFVPKQVGFPRFQGLRPKTLFPSRVNDPKTRVPKIILGFTTQKPPNLIIFYFCAQKTYFPKIDPPKNVKFPFPKYKPPFSLPKSPKSHRN